MFSGIPNTKYDRYQNYETYLQLPECVLQNGVLEKFAKFTGKHLCQSLLLESIATDMQFYSKRVSDTGVFLWILRNRYLPFFTKHLQLTALDTDKSIRAEVVI